MAIDLYKQSKTKATKKERIRLVISIGVDVVAKTDDEICLKYYQTLWFSFVFSVVPKKVELLKISKVM